MKIPMYLTLPRDLEVLYGDLDPISRIFFASLFKKLGFNYLNDQFFFSLGMVLSNSVTFLENTKDRECHYYSAERKTQVRLMIFMGSSET